MFRQFHAKAMIAIRRGYAMVQLAVVLLLASTSVSEEDDDRGEEWVVRVQGGARAAKLLAKRTGYEHQGPVLGFNDTYVWWKNGSRSGKKRAASSAAAWSSKIVWADQQKMIRRYKRDYRTIAEFEWERDESGGRIFNDELWDGEWYLQDTRTNKALPKLDLNVLPLYRLGVTGRGVRIAVLDDGLEYTHDDLRNNYDATISYDVNEGDNDPLPRYDASTTNGHGTRCAGEIAMEANNGKCGVGIAFQASVGGIKLLDGFVNDRVEAEALGYEQGLVDIYTASWGPADDGKSVEGPGRLAAEALERGVNEGRNGKGNIYVWASGNGGSKFDDCGCDGYVGSVYTVAIGSASESARFPWYGEKCAATLATTYSSGAYDDEMIATTDLRNTCTTRHTGTSASAPLAAGILALALQVNNDLTWRDVQHLIAWSSEYAPLRANPGWFKNAAGFWFNSRFGFGLMNAHALVMASYNWTRVPEKTICKVANVYTARVGLAYGNSKKLRFDAGKVCRTATGSRVMFLEHVQVEANLQYSRRGALRMHLVAPSGTSTSILNPRKFDVSRGGFTKWKFLSVATWGEDPRGTWMLLISDEIGPKRNNGTVGTFTLILHGTAQIPAYRRNAARIYKEDERSYGETTRWQRQQQRHRYHTADWWRSVY